MMDLASYSDRGGRAENEDSVRELRQDPDRLCLVVADGLGGHGGGSLASSTAVEVICGAWPGTADVEDLTDMVLRANRAVLSKQLPDCCMKTTVALLALEGAKAAWAHVGDTRLYHFYQGRLDFQTKDHSASQVAVLLGEITPDQIRFHVDRSRILRALGQKDDMRVETKDLVLSPGATPSCCAPTAFGSTCWRRKWSRTWPRPAAPPLGWISCAPGWPSAPPRATTTTRQPPFCLTSSANAKELLA